MPLGDEAEMLRASLKASTGATPTSNQDNVTAAIDRGVAPRANIAQKPDSEKQPLLKLPGDKFYSQPQAEQDNFKSAESITEEVRPQNTAQRDRLESILDALERLPPKSEAIPDKPKVIFATGGITNGKQALDIMDAGADVAMVYTALVYGGIGTISRIKDEMRNEKRKQLSKA